MIQFFLTMSHGKVDLNDLQVFTCTLSKTIAEAKAFAAKPGGTEYQNATFHDAKTALEDQYNVDADDFYAIVVSFQT